MRSSSQCPAGGPRHARASLQCCGKPDGPVFRSLTQRSTLHFPPTPQHDRKAKACGPPQSRPWVNTRAAFAKCLRNACASCLLRPCYLSALREASAMVVEEIACRLNHLLRRHATLSLRHGLLEQCVEFAADSGCRPSAQSCVGLNTCIEAIAQELSRCRWICREQ